MPSLPITRQQALLAALALALALLLAGRFLLRAGTAREAPSAPLKVTRSAPAPPPLLVVDVGGAVRRPGLYRLRQGARVADAVRRAGGATAKAELESVNLAAPLVDGQKVLVPRKAAPGPASPPAAPSPSAPLSLSTASLEELDALPGIGPVTAQKILDYRAQHGGFRALEDLDAVPGIGPARIEQLRGLVTP